MLEEKDGVADGTRTHDNRNHNPGLYQLSYSHHRTAEPRGHALRTASKRRREVKDSVAHPFASNLGRALSEMMARQEGIEPPTAGLEGRCSIH